MGKYILKRILYMIPMMLCVITVIFLVMSLTPGDPATSVLPITATPEAKAAYNASVGWNDSLWVRYISYLKGLLTGNVLSYTTGQNIFSEIVIRLPNTITIGSISFFLSSIIGISLGIFSAVKQYSFADTMITIVAVFFGSVPSFLMATGLILLFAIKIPLFPTFGLYDGVRSYILPITAMTLSSIPVLSRMTRSAMLSVMNMDYVRTARAKGCPESVVIWKHVLKNACLPIITLLVGGFAGIIGGSVIIEQIFSIPGLGLYMLNASNARNVPVVLTCSLLMAFMFMIAMVVLDIFYALIDPKIRSRYK